MGVRKEYISCRRTAEFFVVFQLNAFQALVVKMARKADKVRRETPHRIMSLPFGLNADTLDLPGGVALTGVGVGFNSYKAWIITFQYLLADYVCAHIHDRSKFRGRGLCVFNHSGFGKNGLDFVACGKDSAPTIQYYAALRQQIHKRLLLCDTGIDRTFFIFYSS